jgi:LysR family cys regulon transcriptional activator
LFATERLTANIALTARAADVIKTYVRLGLGIGIGIVADVAIDPETDADLLSIAASHLFSTQTAWAGFMRGSLLRGYMYDFLSLLAPHLARKHVERAAFGFSQVTR